VDVCGCEGFARTFDRRTAEQDRDRYRRSGPNATTRLLLDQVRRYGLEGSTILDVGGGIGVIDLELLRAGAGHAVLVDASEAYLKVARQEARRLNILDRIDFVAGDFVAEAGGIDAADIVTLDKVVCCYRDAEALVGLSSARARTVYALVLPRDRWFVRLSLRLENLLNRLRGRAFRAYPHSNRKIDRIVAANGLKPRFEATTIFWRIVVYDRAG
jgi:magnesium-protoporphyrin O-methyltransferase